LPTLPSIFYAALIVYMHCVRKIVPIHCMQRVDERAACP